MIIDKTDLAYLLEKNKAKIGHNAREGKDVIANSATFFFSALFSSYDTYGVLLGYIAKAVAVFVSAGFLVWGVYKFIRSKKDKYGSDQLMKDIENIDKTEHKFSLVAIKDTFNEHPNRFLTCYNEKWACWMLPYFRTHDNEPENVAFIRNGIANQLKVNAAEIDVKYITFNCRGKTNPETGVCKHYAHSLYSLTMQLPAAEQADRFEIEGTKYRWMSIAEMLADPDIQEKNLDVVALVKDNIA